MIHFHLSYRFVVLSLLLTAACCQAATPSEIVGTYQGGGRACYGALTIRRHSISWRTPFSTCNNALTVSAKIEDSKGAKSYSLKLTHPLPKTCRYSNIILIEHTPTDANKTWEVIGYPIPADQEAHRLENALSCPLIRLR